MTDKPDPALINGLGAAAASAISTQVHHVDGQDLCRVHVPPSSFAIDARVKVEKNGQLLSMTAFYIRIGNGTREVDGAERQKYVSARWAGSPSRQVEVRKR